MQRFLFFIAAAGLLLGTLGSGWLHGRIHARWQRSDQVLELAADRLGDELPPRVGPWELEPMGELDAEVKRMLQCVASPIGRYVNPETGERIRVAIVAGPSGPISVHTPEICYSSKDYEIAGERQLSTITDRKGGKHNLWMLQANAVDSMRSDERIYYAWSTGQQWEAANGPRYAYAGYPVLYKLQVVGPVVDNPSAKSPDPCQDFLTRFLTQIQPQLVTSKRLSFLAP